MRSYTITSVWGIPIRVNTSLLIFLPILAWLIGSGGQIELYAGVIEGLTGVGFDVPTLRAGFTPWLIGIGAAVGLFVGVTLHELGHSWVALRYGLEIESITLWILGGIASLRSIPREWDREFWIAIAGPVVSVLVGAVSYAVLLVVPPGLQAVRFVIGWLAIVNVVLAGFNLLPAFPMDGGRILRALLSRSRPYAIATRLAARVGVVFAFLFAVVGALSFNLIMLLLAWFLYSAATTESRTVLTDELLHGLSAGDIMSRGPETVSANTSVAELVDRILHERRTVYPVTDVAGEYIGIVTLENLRDVASADQDTTRVDEVMAEPLRVGATADAFETLSLLAQSGTRAALVEDDGVVVGVLSESDFAHVLTIQRGFRAGVPG
jgi:Zn-dependent protease/CBS domain-containing protein